MTPVSFLDYWHNVRKNNIIALKKQNYVRIKADDKWISDTAGVWSNSEFTIDVDSYG